VVLDESRGRFDIHARADRQKPYGKPISDYLYGWEQLLRPLIAKDGRRFRVFLWGKKRILSQCMIVLS
jgi:hypothetical protein